MRPAVTLLGDINAVTKQVRAFAWVLVYVDWSLENSSLKYFSCDSLGDRSDNIYFKQNLWLFLNITLELGKSNFLYIDHFYVSELSIFGRRLKI